MMASSSHSCRFCLSIKCIALDKAAGPRKGRTRESGIISHHIVYHHPR